MPVFLFVGCNHYAIRVVAVLVYNFTVVSFGQVRCIANGEIEHIVLAMNDSIGGITQNAGENLSIFR